MKSTLVRFASFAALVALVACSGNSSSSATNTADNTAANTAAADNSAASPAAADNSAASPAAADDASTAAFGKLGAAELNGFADVLGDKAADDADGTYYGSKVVIPNMKCVITISKKNTDKVATCQALAKTQADADAAFASAKQAAQAALPDLKPSVQSAGSKYIASYFATSDKQTVTVYESKKGDGFQVGVAFATPDFYK